MRSKCGTGERPHWTGPREERAVETAQGEPSPRSVPCLSRRPHAETKTSVQIEMADVGPVIARTSQTYLRIEIGAVDINLSAMRMDDLANPSNRRLKHAVCRRIGDHDRCKPICDLFGLCFQIRNIDIASSIACDRDDIHPGHVSRCRVGAVC